MVMKHQSTLRHQLLYSPSKQTFVKFLQNFVAIESILAVILWRNHRWLVLRRDPQRMLATFFQKYFFNASTRNLWFDFNFGFHFLRFWS